MRIRAINFSVTYDSACSSFKKYACEFSRQWTTYIERSGSVVISDSLSYEGECYSKRWIFGTGQMPNTENVFFPQYRNAGQGTDNHF
ncbi:MAG: hypothetical protein R3B47_20840 [Bacteroidia bacterium]